MLRIHDETKACALEIENGQFSDDVKLPEQARERIQKVIDSSGTSLQ